MTKVEQQATCAVCTWDKNCIEPPAMTEDMVKNTVAELTEGKEGEGAVLASVMSMMIFGGKDREANVCPVFAEALRSGPELSQSIKATMQGR